MSTSVVPCGAPLARCLASSGPLSGVARRWRGLPLSLYIVPKTSTNTKSKRQNQNSRAPSGTATLTLSRQHRTRHSSQDGSRHRTRHTPRVRAEILLILTYTVLLSCNVVYGTRRARARRRRFHHKIAVRLQTRDSSLSSLFPLSREAISPRLSHRSLGW